MPEHFSCSGGGDAAAYALGALDDHELDGFRRHLSTCSVCQAEIQSFEQLTDVLPMSAPQLPAPTALRRRVMTEVRTDARRQRTAREASEARGLGGLRVGGLRAGGMRSGGWNLGPSRHPGLIGAAVAVLLVLVVVVVGVTASGTSKPGTKTSATHVYAASVGSGQLLVSAGHGELIVHKLSQVSVAQTYEVWEQRASGPPQPTSALFNTSSTGDSAVTLPGSLQGVKEILVTKEPAAGTAKPTGKPVVVARIA
jgi:anti-sigma factor RsiW